MMSTRTGVRALVMVTLCYGALEIVGLLLLLLLLLSPASGRKLCNIQPAGAHVKVGGGALAI